MIFSYRGLASADSAAATGLTCAAPTGIQNNDIIFALFMSQSGYCATPSGWNFLVQQRVNNFTYTQLFWKIASNESGTYNFDVGGIVAKTRVDISAFYHGFDIDNPIFDYNSTVYISSNTIMRSNGITGLSSQQPLLFFMSSYRTAAMTYTKPTAPENYWEEHYDTGNSDSDRWTSVDSLVWSGSGSTGTVDGACSAATSTKHVFMVALNKPPTRRRVVITHTNLKT